MTQIEKLRLIADAMEGKVKIEICWFNEWRLLTHSVHKVIFTSDNGVAGWNILELLANEIRIAQKLPLLTEEECGFLKWFPQDWWIARDESENIYVYENKPTKKIHTWSFNSMFIGIKYHPPFNGITWEDSDCYTIGELIEYSKKK